MAWLLAFVRILGRALWAVARALSWVGLCLFLGVFGLHCWWKVLNHLWGEVAPSFRTATVQQEEGGDLVITSFAAAPRNDEELRLLLARLNPQGEF